MMTNEERQLEIYATSESPTEPNSVTADTPLEELNLNWRERDLPEKQRTKHVHRLHPYLGKFIPQLVEIFLRKYFVAGQTVLDPFCGSGTTLVQANELGINSFGWDISAFNVLLAEVKTQHYDLNVAAAEVYRILDEVQGETQPNAPLSLNGNGDAQLVYDSDISEESDDYLSNWFSVQSLKELLAYRSILHNGNFKYPNLLKIILSRAARSARLAPHYELDHPKNPQSNEYWCYKHSRICVPTNGAFKFLKRYSIDTLRRVQDFAQVQTAANATICHADSKAVTFPAVDGVVTSPPYVGLIDYHQQHTYAFRLLGLPDQREEEIGAAVEGTGRIARN